jgi:hypothetical protein
MGPQVRAAYQDSRTVDRKPTAESTSWNAFVEQARTDWHATDGCSSAFVLMSVHVRHEFVGPRGIGEPAPPSFPEEPAVRNSSDQCLRPNLRPLPYGRR